VCEHSANLVRLRMEELAEGASSFEIAVTSTPLARTSSLRRA
jgi:hypothetical protein